MSGKFEGAAVLFDLDGTFIDTARDLGAATNAALVELGLDPIPLDRVQGLIGNGARAMLARGYAISAGRDAAPSVLDEGFRVFLDFYGKNIAVHSAPFDGAVASLNAMRAQGAKIAICTNKRERLAVKLLDALGLRGCFQTIVGGDSAAAKKPNPAPIHLCMERLGSKRAVFVGDSDTDLKAAAAAGIPCILVEFGYGPTELAENASARVGHYREMEAAIAALL